MSPDEREPPGDDAPARGATGNGPPSGPVESPRADSDEGDGSPRSALLAAVMAAAILVYIVLNWPALWDPWADIVIALLG